jgi:hypothetical protein
MVVEIGVAMAIGFILGRIWQIRSDLEQQHAGDFKVPPTARIRNCCEIVAELLAVVRLMTRSNLESRSTGRSAGFAAAQALPGY